MRSRRLPFALLGLVVLVTTARVAAVWDDLPATVASHFGPAGTPDGWMTRGGFFLVFLGLFAFTIAVLVSVPLWLAAIPPALVNLPNREHWLAPERRGAAIGRLGVHLTWFAVGTATLVAAVLELVLRANLSRGPLAAGPMWAFLGGYLVFAAIWLRGLYRAFRVPPAA